MRIGIIGCGYVGIVTGSCLASHGHHVTMLDTDTKKIDLLRCGEVPIYEAGLESLLKNNRHRMTFFSTYDDFLSDGDEQLEAIFLCVGTPESKLGGADLSYLYSAVAKLPPNQQFVLVVKSTVPVGTCRMIQEAGSFHVVSNPEFLREGVAINDFLRPDRIILGCPPGSPAGGIMADLYRPFVRDPRQIIIMDRWESAELTKYATNAMLATRISFMNDLSRFAENHGADIEEVRVGLGADERIGNAFLYPGIGFGGSCFPKDCNSLIWQDKGETLGVVTAAMNANREQRNHAVGKVLTALLPSHPLTLSLVEGDLQENKKRKTVAILGLAFKPGTDDVRESPGLHIAKTLLGMNVNVRLTDPVALHTAHAEMNRWLLDTPLDDKDPPTIELTYSIYDAVQGADVIVLCTEWPEYRRPDLKELARRANASATVIDGRNIWSRESVLAAGLKYDGIGR